MSKDTMNGLEGQTELGTTLPAFDLDPAEYMDELASFDMTEAQKLELLQTLWSIMGSFVELGFTVDICEQLFQDSGLLPTAAPQGVKSDNTTTTEKRTSGAEKERQ
jgi:hypothetical protein